MNLACATQPGIADTSPMHFTGKQRDSETGLDYFGARFNASNLGRFMTPDWSEAPMGVPYADFDDPQTLNLYSYTRNNPMLKADQDGHCPQCIIGAGVGAATILFKTAKFMITGKGSIPSNREIAGAIIGGAIGGALVPGSGGILTNVVSKGGMEVVQATVVQRAAQAAVAGVVSGATNTAIATGDGNKATDLTSVGVNALAGAAANVTTGAIISSTTLSGNASYMNNLPASPSATGTAATDALAYSNTAQSMAGQLAQNSQAVSAAVKTAVAAAKTASTPCSGNACPGNSR
jgi:RHS repeat-associated protein